VRGAPAHRAGPDDGVRKIDEIIKLIRASRRPGEAKQKLREKFKFTERQAEDIVNLRSGS
jgi:DNA gyrase/topoisomerase IV subunit A